jgi:hypothetical protein
MPSMSIVTPTYRPDLDLFADLHESVERWTPDDVVHHVMVPDCDVTVYRRFGSERCRIWPLGELIPDRYHAVPKLNVWINGRRPWPPVRGWVMQQLAKLSIAARLDTDAVVFADSDIVFVRPVTDSTFLQHGEPVLYRAVDAIEGQLPTHELWHRVARELLGAAPARPPFDDFVSALTVWEPHRVRRLQDRIEAVHGVPWFDAAARQVHFSEDTLYGVFAMDASIRNPTAASSEPPPPTTSTSRCHCYWEHRPLDTRGATEFAMRLATDDVAVSISSKSHTPLGVRRAAWAQLRRTLVRSSS